MRLALAAAVSALALGLPAAASAAPEVGPIPVCDLDGHCDRRCWVGTYGVRCGF